MSFPQAPGPAAGPQIVAFVVGWHGELQPVMASTAQEWSGDELKVKSVALSYGSKTYFSFLALLTI
jgi:hypothetical protein